jgi:xanthine dehydrogenase accessory factor
MTTTPPSASDPSAADDPLVRLGRALRVAAEGGSTAAVVRVLDRHGFGTVESGQIATLTPGGDVVGPLLRDAMTTQVADLAERAADGPEVHEAHVAEDDAVAAGLACAGGATLLGHPLPVDVALALGTTLEEGRSAALVSTLDGTRSLVRAGADLELTVGTLGSADLDRSAVEAVGALARRGATATQRTALEDVDVLIDLWVPVPTVTIVGRGAIGAALVAQADVLGWRHRTVTEVAQAAAAVERFGDADVLVLLDHSADFDPVLITAATRGRGFLGLLGSRHTQAARATRLRAAGLDEIAMGRFRGPVGLDLGARTPAETAVSIVAQVIAARGGRAGTALGAAEGPISAI